LQIRKYSQITENSLFDAILSEAKDLSVPPLSGYDETLLRCMPSK